MTIREDVRQLVDYEGGHVAARVHFDPALYDDESSKVFGRNWLVVGHELMIPQPGDFITNYMGEVPVIVTRVPNGDVQVLVNRCTHRGNQVCLFDRGNTRGFSCSYHGWSYDLQGAMLGAPFEERVYVGGLDKSELGLKSATVAVFAGLIFATFDEHAEPLEQWLDPDVQWWLRNYVAAEPVGGLELLPGWHRYSSSGNWKLASENFIGDNYHVWASSHVATLATGRDYSERGIKTPYSHARQLMPTPGSVFDISVGAIGKAPLGLGIIGTDTTGFEADLMTAEGFGKDAKDWIEYRNHQYLALTKDLKHHAYGFMHGLLYPNLGLMGFGSPFMGRQFLLFHPRGVELHEFWQWTMVERDAPQEIKDLCVSRAVFAQHMAGVIAPDDVENMERIVDASHAESNWDHRFHYGIQIGNEIANGEDDLPGAMVPNPSELNQRRFYQYWAEQMAARAV